MSYGDEEYGPAWLSCVFEADKTIDLGIMEEISFGIRFVNYKDMLV